MSSRSLAGLRDDLRGAPRRPRAGRALPRCVVALTTMLAVMGGAVLLPPAAPPPPPPASPGPVCERSIQPDDPPASGGGAVELGPEPVAVDTDGDGCSEAARWQDGVLTIDGTRFALGRRGDRVLVGDWDCDATLSPALVRSDGEVFVFDTWGGADGTETARRADGIDATCPAARWGAGS